MPQGSSAVRPTHGLYLYFQYTCPASIIVLDVIKIMQKGKGLPQQAEVAQGVPGRLRARIVLTFGTTRVVGR